MQFDEKWSFVGKKEKHCDRDKPQDARRGDCWDHVALDAEHRLVVSVVVGRRSTENVQRLVQDFKRRTQGRRMNLMTSDEYDAYETAILATYGETVAPPRTGQRGRPQKPYPAPPADLQYATVHKTREKGRVTKISCRVIFGAFVAVLQALAGSLVSRSINTAFVERQHGTDRHRNSRKVRKTYGFSKDWFVHEAMTYFTLYSYNFCWPVRTLRRKTPQGTWQPQTPAMAAQLTDHVWTSEEWIKYPALQRS